MNKTTLLVISFAILNGSILRIANAESEPLNSDIKVEISKNLREQLSALPKTNIPSKRIKQIQYDFISSAKKYPAISGYENIDHQLIGINSAVEMPAIKIVSHEVTLKGLIDLAHTNESTTDSDTPLNIMFSGFSFFGIIHNQLEMGSIFNTTSLTGDLAAIVNPQPETQFSYIHSWELKQVTKNIIGTKNSSENTFSVTCSVSNPQDASTLNSGFKGQYLPVKCEGKNRENKEFTNKFAYLLDSQIYIRLSEISTYMNTYYKYTGSIEYVSP